MLQDVYPWPSQRCYALLHIPAQTPQLLQLVGSNAPELVAYIKKNTSINYKSFSKISIFFFQTVNQIDTDNCTEWKAGRMSFADYLTHSYIVCDFIKDRVRQPWHLSYSLAWRVHLSDETWKCSLSVSMLWFCAIIILVFCYCGNLH